jgi:hypothetical protein
VDVFVKAGMVEFAVVEALLMADEIKAVADAVPDEGGRPTQLASELF